jgi:protease I
MFKLIWNLSVCRQAGYLVLVILCVALGIGPAFSQEGSKMKKVVMIIAQEGFRDEELLVPKDILEKNGIEVKVASSSLSQAKGMLGATVKPDLTVNDINVRDFSAVIFVGGIGSNQYWDDPMAHKLVQQAINNNRIIAAICLAPVTLAKAGILKDKRATVFYTEAGQLKALGANYTGQDVERDGNIITASGPPAARRFAEELVRAILY